MESYATRLERFGDAPALVDEDGAVTSYASLARQADALAAEIGTTRKLILLEAKNNVSSVVTIMACLRGGHPLIIGSEAARERIVAAFEPDLVIDSWGVRIEHEGSASELHPDLAIMLSTSGSTGATKLVRLSHKAIDANAASIVEYLRIASDDRALTTLPISYSYGLSVLNSHLSAGASVVLTDRSVVDNELWALFDSTGSTSIAGVPYTYELLEATGFRDRTHKSLRTMTQAGGRLAPEIIETYFQWSRDSGSRFYTMYGQTEATARMAYLPPEMMEGHFDCIGVPIPGGTLRLANEDGSPVGPGETGEMIYTGDNVMMGYATERADLAKGAELTELKTGDLAKQVDGGLFKVVGRSSRFSKIAGLRVGLDEIEHMLKENGIEAVVAGDDTLVSIGVIDEEHLEAAERVVDIRTTIPLRSRIVFALGDTPRLLSGKVDYPAVRAAGRAAFEAGEQVQLGGSVGNASALAAVFARALNRAAVSPNDSFRSLAGDSLAYIEVSMAIERTLGHLPDHWESLTIEQIEMMAASAPPVSGKRQFRSVASEMLIRPIAMTTIILGHTVEHSDMIMWKGGALTLLMAAGYNAARFQRDQMISDKRWGLLVNFFIRFLVPYYIVMLVYELFAANTHAGLPTLLLVNTYFKDDAFKNFGHAWFIQALLHLILIMITLFAIKPIRKFAVEQPWNFALVLIGVAGVARFGTTAIFPADILDQHGHRLDLWAYTFPIGWALASADTARKKLLLVALAFVFTAFDRGVNTATFYVLAGAVVLMFVPRVTVWSPIAEFMALLAQATYYIYLVHGIARHLVGKRLGIESVPLKVAGGIALGLLFFFFWRWVLATFSRLMARLRRQEAPLQEAASAI